MILRQDFIARSTASIARQLAYSKGSDGVRWNLIVITVAVLFLSLPFASGLQRKKMNSESAVQQLETYVLRPDDFHGDAIPRRLERQEVARFVVERVGKDAGFKSLVRLERLVNFYDLQEVCGHLSSLLPTAPTPGDVMKAAVIARTVAATCGPADVQRMASYAPGLIANAQNTADIAELLELQDRLGPGVDSRALEARIGQLRAAYAASSGSNYQARLETSRLDEMRNLRLDRVRRGNETKAQVLAIADRPKRISEEIKIYLTLDYGYLEYLLPWSAARLRRETWGQSPADQTVRKEDPARRSEVAKMFHTVGANLERLPDVDPENRPSLQVRCLRAVSYFGSALSGPEWTFISDHAGRQVDVLSND